MTTGKIVFYAGLSVLTVIGLSVLANAAFSKSGWLAKRKSQKN